MKKSVLFVDDEPNVLDALQRMLRGLRHDWNMRFVSSGFQAIEVMETSPADIVISDMCMPGMNGAELFAAIACRWPNTVRIILSGQFDKETARLAYSFTHQFLAKPCSAKIIKETLEKIDYLQEELSE